MSAYTKVGSLGHSGWAAKTSAFKAAWQPVFAQETAQSYKFSEDGLPSGYKIGYKIYLRCRYAAT